jgi:hypothetical protein
VVTAAEHDDLRELRAAVPDLSRTAVAPSLKFPRKSPRRASWPTASRSIRPNVRNRSLERQLAKARKFAQMMAGHAFARGMWTSLSKGLLAPAWRLRRGDLLRGYLDGWHGNNPAYVHARFDPETALIFGLPQIGRLFAAIPAFRLATPTPPPRRL